MNINLPMSSLLPGTQQLLSVAMKGEWPYRQFYMGSNLKLPDDMALDQSEISLKNVPTPFTDWTRQAASNFGELAVVSPKGFFHVCAFVAADSIGQQLNADYYLRGVESGKSRQEAKAEVEADASYAKLRGQADKQDSEINDPFELLDDVITHPDDPDIKAKVKLKIKDDSSNDDPGTVEWKHFAAQEKAIAAASGLSIVSDSFNRMAVEANALSKANSLAYLDAPRVPGVALGEGEAKLQDILDGFAAGYCYNWERKAGVIEFRSRDWFRKRCSQLPDEWLEQWRQLLRKNGTLTLQEFAQIATLTFEQLAENVQQDSVLGCCVASVYPDWNIIRNQAILRLYLRLDQDQRQLLFSQNGLPLPSLNPDEWQLVVDACHYPYNGGWGTWDGFLKNNGRGVVVTATTITDHDSAGERIDYSFKISSGKDSSASWWITMPKYVPPKKPQPVSPPKAK